MRIKLDENLSLRLKAGLAELGHDADTVRDEELTGKPDGDVWAAAMPDRLSTDRSERERDAHA
jgi:predicted nuclease of predicted toxin-antitoxin system